MTAIDLGRLRALIELVHDLPPARRAEVLDRECGSDAALRAEVEDVLRSAESSPGFLDAPDAWPRAAGFLPESAPTLLVGARVAGFELVRRIASGGMGTVWEALQDEPRRRVALKTMSRANGSREALRRFRHESEILARLRHPNVAQVFASGVHVLPGGESLPWFALEFVEDARTIVDHARERSLDVRARLELFAALCDAVQHGHERGVIHRDLKPNNVLVDATGAVKVIDFGVARVRSDEEATQHTEPGRLIGTLQYMSPEQISGATDEIDTRSDVYALGVLLYELLAGAPPYDLTHASLAEAARILVEDVPPRPSARQRGLSPDLDAIVLKALEKDRARRYASAAAMAQDVRRHLRGDAVEARTPSLAYHLQTFARRHRLIVASLAVVLIVLVGAAIFSARAAFESRGSEQRALGAAEVAQFREYTASVAAAYAAIRSLDAGSARQQLERCPADLRGFEWWYLNGRVDRSLWTRAADGVAVIGLSWSADGTRILASSDTGVVEIRDARSGATIERGARADGLVMHASADADGAHIAQILYDGTVRLIATDPLREVRRWHAHEGNGTCAGFTSDGSGLVTSGRIGEVSVWNVADGSLRTRLEKSRHQVLSQALSPDGTLLAAGTGLGSEVLTWDFATGALRDRWKGHTGYLAQLRFFDGGRRLASASHDRTVRVWDVASGACIFVLRGHDDLVFGVDADEAGARLVSSSWDRTIRLWDMHDGSELATLVGHASSVTHAAFSPDGRRLVSADDGSNLKLWDVARSEPDLVRVRGKWLWKLRYWSDGASLLAIHGGFAQRLRADDGDALAEFPATDAEWRSGEPSPDGSIVALGDTKGFVELWTADGARRLARVALNARTILELGWAHDSTRLFAVGLDGGIRVIDRDGEHVTELCPPGRGRTALAVQPGGTLIATAAARGELCLYDLATGAQVFEDAPRFAQVNHLAWNADGTRLAMALSDGRIVLWDARARAVERELIGHETSVEDVAFSPDGARLVSGSTDRSVRLWDPDSGREVAAFVDHTHYVDAVAFAPDGATMVSASSDSTLRLYRGASAAQRRVEQLRATRFLARDVRAALLAEPVPTPDERDRRLALADRIGDDPVELAREAWLLLRWPGSEPHRLALAHAMTNAAAAHAPDHPLVVRAVAAAHLRLGDPSAALAALQRLEVGTDDARERALLDALEAIALARLGRKAEAEERIRSVSSSADTELRRVVSEARRTLEDQ